MIDQPMRTATGGLVDRSRRLEFHFDGQHLHGYAGDTLASALLANGVRLVGRSFKYHRPRGILGAAAEEPNALIQLGEGDTTEPNVRATQVELASGMVSASQNRWPTLRHDLGALANAFSRILPAGFYYKTFMWPPGWWMRYERYIRRMAGLGRAPGTPDPDRYAKRHAHCDVLVVGGGPAGLAAALAAARRGVRVILVDERPRFGGSLLAQIEHVGTAPALQWVDETVAELQTLGNVRVLRRATAFGYYDQNLVAVAECLSDARGPAYQPRQRTWWIRARRVVLATGAIERPLVFADNDRPGVMLASAVRTYAYQYGVRCGERAVVFTNNDSAYDTVPALLSAGATVGAVIDVRESGPGEDARASLAGSGAELLHGQVVVRARGGRRGLEAVEVMPFGAARGVSGKRTRLDCDLLCVSGGWSPTVHLFSQSQGRLRYDSELAAFVPGESRQAEQSVGAARGSFSLGACLGEGVRAGTEAAKATGATRRARVQVPETRAPSCSPIQALWAVPLPEDGAGKRFVDFQNDVTVEDVALAAREGYSSVEHVKRYTTLGMGTDQGRTSNVNGLAILATQLGRDVESVGTTTFRPPYTPVTLGAIAGREVGAEFSPIRRTPLHEWHERAGAPFVTAGQWLRAQCYPHAGEGLMDAINREVLAVRAGVGVVDVSTLGKIEIRGRDAGEFLERVYINRWRNLKVGRVRYGLMLREDGFVLDDGTTTRVAEDEFYMTTTTGHAGPVMSHLEFYAQTVWPQLHVHLTSVSDQWAGLALAGPRSRDVLAAACDGADVGNEQLPFMGYLEATIDGAPVRLFRLTFSGELAYEIHAPSDYALRVWEAVLDAGAPWGITPYGTEAMGVLRIEKGHVVAAELDGTTLAADFGFDALYRGKASDFIGRRSLDRPALDGSEPRRTLVGLISEDGRHIPRGAQLVSNPAKPKPLQMLGHVTSTCYSPTLGREIALALLRDAQRHRDQVLYAASPLAGHNVPVRVTSPVFVDPDGTRFRG